ncbi:recombination regulator RecX [Acetatifactor muris]|nr:regulatory protein RecX [Acetatifactor muris]MCI8801361.1 regulatory protein RecX [Lachnospiraceae bacterium]MCR2047559.1 recombination regulator RecX [Acetatifactor muris]
MKVTQIEEVSKSRVRIYVEDEFAFVLYKGELRSFHIREGEEIEQECYEEILTKLLPKRAKLRAMNLLKTREYTVKQLQDKLKMGGYPENVIEEALAYVASFHYTDDLRYAVSFIEGHSDNRSRRRIEQDLLRRGIDRSTLEKAWLQWEEQGGDQDEQKMIQALLAKKGFASDKANLKERQRMYGFLMRKGFSGEQVRRAVLKEMGDWL